MISPRKRAVFVVISEETDARLQALKQLDKVVWSGSRVINQCIEDSLAKIEKKAGIFKSPTKKSSGRRTNQAA